MIGVNGSASLAPGFIICRFEDELRQTVFQFADRRRINCDCVQVMTYHKSKGLEWPVVILASLKKEFKPQVFGVIPQTDGQIDPKNPLANRWIRFIPMPFAGNTTTIFDNNQAYQECGIQTEEFKRLMYVGVTRAKEKLIFAFNCSRGNNPTITAKWLEQMGMQPEESDNGKKKQIGAQSIPLSKPQTCEDPQNNTLRLDPLPEQNVLQTEAPVQNVPPRRANPPVAATNVDQRALHSLELWAGRPQEKCARIIQYIVDQADYAGTIEWDGLLDWVQYEYPNARAEGTIRSMMNGNGNNYGQILERVGRGGPVRIRPELQNFVMQRWERHAGR